ncbi:MAG: 5,6-dimethylbenzimidazole synthase [Rhodospirillales bacterium]|nr:5,6-dimethylbenzimidazole synthase [Rhodospirillales bacterium]
MELSTAPDFDEAFKDKLEDLFRWRRDVRKFKTDPLPVDLVDKILSIACVYSPSVGNSQPWRFVKVNDPKRRAAVKENFEIQNREALDNYQGEKAKLYASLKLAGLDQAPVHIAVFADTQTERGAGLGQSTMPETLKYSAANAIYTFWLAARAYGVGVGWVSIVDPKMVADLMDTPPEWEFMGYLCVGYPEEENQTPELVRHGWQERGELEAFIFER